MPSPNIESIVSNSLCIGCGFCAATCKQGAIGMTWNTQGVWEPAIHEKRCARCSRCYSICPQSPESLLECAKAATAAGERFGLEDGECYIGYANDDRWRGSSASGGVLSLLAASLVESGKVDGIICSFPRKAVYGEPHFELRIARSGEEVARSRSSHYHPHEYHGVLQQVLRERGRYAFLGLPCHLRGVNRFPSEFSERILFTLCLVCSHNVSSRFADCLAKREGVHSGERFTVNLRDKLEIPDANNFNNVFSLDGRTIRRNRFETAFTPMWRNYFFAREGCLYCPDFYGKDADLSVKDAWGRLSDDPLGKSFLLVRNPQLDKQLRLLAGQGAIHLESTSADEVFSSQPDTPRFKHVGIRDRLVWKRCIRRKMLQGEDLPASRRWWTIESRRYWSLRSALALSDFLYGRFGRVPVRSLIRLTHPYQSLASGGKRLFSTLTKPVRGVFRRIGRFCGLVSMDEKASSISHILIAGGYGYGNVGDEAQLSANLQLWRRIVPGCSLTVLTPAPPYTEKTHGVVRTELAPRLAIFGRHGREYYGSEKVFRRKFWGVAAVLLFNACLLRAGLPLMGVTARQARLLTEIARSDVLFLSGGGYLTGMTLTRLWENMLLLRLAQMLGVNTLLSGQTIGVFNGFFSRILARWGLREADLIYLRDAEESPKALSSIGVEDKKVECTFDDALFCDVAADAEVHGIIRAAGGDPEQAYLAVNVHYWGQSPEVSRTIMREMASVLDWIQAKTDLQIVFAPMHSTDEEAVREVSSHMRRESMMPLHEYRADLAVGLVKKSKICLTMKHHPIIFAMAGSVPTLCMTFDDYYRHKNVGAMKIFGQERFVIAGVPEKLSQQVTVLFEELWLAKDEIAETIGERLERLRPRSGEIIRRWVQGKSTTGSFSQADR